MENTDGYPDTMEDVHRLLEQSNFDCLSIEEETDSEAIILDQMESTEFPLRVLSSITAEWLQSKLFISPKLKYRFGFDAKKMAGILLQIMGKAPFMTLNQLFFIYNSSDWGYVAKRLGYRRELQGEALEDLRFDGLGIMWHFESACAINVRAIEKAALELINDGAAYMDEFDYEFSIGVISTVIHELLHLQRNTNPFCEEENGEEYQVEADCRVLCDRMIQTVSEEDWILHKKSVAVCK